MFPKPSTGTPTREYYNGEKHCILVAASDPFTGKVTMVLPKIREGEFACTDVEICRVDYRHVVRMFTPVINMCSCPLIVNLLYLFIILMMIILLHAACHIPFSDITQETSNLERDIQSGKILSPKSN